MMSADGDTFDIDIYGDDAQDEQPAQAEDLNPEDNLYDEEDSSFPPADDGTAQSAKSVTASDSTQRQQQAVPASQTSQDVLHQGTKRKATPDETNMQHQPSSRIDPNATAALKLTDLHWWTTEEDVRAFCATAQAESSLVDIAFGEHKINGKSRGEAYLEFSSPAAASAVKIEVEKKSPGDPASAEARRANPFHVYFTVVGNPFKGRDSGAVGKKDYAAGSGRGGAYNSFNNNSRGGFAGRGSGGYSRGGGGGYSRGGGYMSNNNNNGTSNNNMMNNQWGMGNGSMGMGFGGNPMMAMGGFGNMGRGGMGNMMGRGNFGAGMGNMGGMSNMMGMGVRGGGGMMMGGGRGGWGAGMMGGGMQQGYGGGGGGSGGNYGGGMGMQQQGSQGQGQQSGQPNKRMKAE